MPWNQNPSQCEIPHRRERDHSNRLGEHVVKKYKASKDKTPGGACYEVCHQRVKDAAREVCGVPLPDLTRSSTFGKLWGSLMTPIDEWMKLPEEYRGEGAAGAMEWEGLGTMVSSMDIWNGKLKPGAVIQVWADMTSYQNVKKGVLADISTGHSFFFLEYVKSGSAIIGMKIADQGYQSGRTVKKGEWAYWVGANIYCG